MSFHRLHPRLFALFAFLAVFACWHRRATAERRNAVYLELLGKGGLWGVGWDLQLGSRFGAGVTASYSVIDREEIMSLSPYVAAVIAGGAHHRWFLHAGPQLVNVTVRSPVPEWSGSSSFGVGAQLSSGYEYRNGILVRVFAMAAAGRGRLAPWLGVSIGWTL